MKVVIVTESYPPEAGGSGWSSHQLAKVLRDAGHPVEVLFLGKHRGEYFYDGIPVCEVQRSPVRVPGLKLIYQEIVDATRLAILLDKKQSLSDADVIHAQHRISTLGAARAVSRAGAKISTVRDYWPICDTGQLFADLRPCEGCSGLKIGRCLGQRYPVVRNMVPIFPVIAYFRRARRLALGKFDAVISVSGYVADRIRHCVKGERLHRVPNMVEVDPSASPKGRAKRAIFVGKLEPSKGAHLLPKLAEALPDGSELAVAGTGSLSEYLASVAPTRVKFLGWRSRGELQELMGTSSLLVFPSLWPEPLSRVLLESSALGLPIVAFAVGGNSEIVYDGVNGYLVGSTQEMADKMKQILTDPQLRDRLSEGGRQIARERFSPPKVLPQLLSVYKSALQGHRN